MTTCRLQNTHTCTTVKNIHSKVLQSYQNGEVVSNVQGQRSITLHQEMVHLAELGQVGGMVAEQLSHV